MPEDWCVFSIDCRHSCPILTSHFCDEEGAVEYGKFLVEKQHENIYAISVKELVATLKEKAIKLQEFKKEEFATRLKKIRESQCLTQIELAQLTGLVLSYIDDFEAERREPNIANLKKIANALNVKIDFLLGQ